MQLDVIFVTRVIVTLLLQGVKKCYISRNLQTLLESITANKKPL